MNEGILEVFENNHIDPPISHGLVILSNVVLWMIVVFCIRKIVACRRDAREAERLEKKDAALALGNRFVAGTVELARGEALAVDVTVTQSGSQQKSKNGYSHQFTEAGRETRARPFYLRHASGARVRVEPPADVLLVDELDQMEWLDKSSRRRRAELVPGEWAVVEGVLEEAVDPEADAAPTGYRSAANRGYLVRLPREGRMQVSAEPLSRRHELRGKLFRRALGAVFVLGIAVNVMMVGYWERVVEGKDVVATMTKKGVYTTRDSKGRTSTHYGLYLSYQDGAGKNVSRVLDVDDDDYERIIPGPLPTWIRRVDRFPRLTALGPGVSVPLMAWLFAWIPVLIGWGVATWANDHRRWYEGRVVDNGSGELPSPSGQRFRNPRPDRSAERR